MMRRSGWWAGDEESCGSTGQLVRHTVAIEGLEGWCYRSAVLQARMGEGRPREGDG